MNDSREGGREGGYRLMRESLRRWAEVPVGRFMSRSPRPTVPTPLARCRCIQPVTREDEGEEGKGWRAIKM